MGRRDGVAFKEPVYGGSGGIQERGRGGPGVGRAGKPVTRRGSGPLSTQNVLGLPSPHGDPAIIDVEPVLG
jgi:hypothetical protein